MEYTIRNDRLALTADTLGAELHALTTAQGLPLLWSGDPAVWPRHAPVCFPWCGALEGGWYEDSGTVYRGERHGFVRAAEHRLVSDGPDGLHFAMDWPGDGDCWPWPFRFETVHTLEGDRAITTCTAENRGGRPMPVQFGFHPAFRCPFLPDTRLEEYLVRFENGIVVPLYRALFDLDSICFPQAGAWARLEHGPTGRYLQVDTAEFLYVLLWSKPGVPGFVCIEPWRGYPGPGHRLTDRPGAELLQPGERRSWRQTITVHL